VRRDEVEAQWYWIDAVRACWAENKRAPELYRNGSLGPASATELVERDGRTWHD
jgi:Glucose-6-phosphate 1-dehydrogenase